MSEQAIEQVQGPVIPTECPECGDPWEWHTSGACTGDACDCKRRIPDGWTPDDEPEPSEQVRSESPANPEAEPADPPEWAHGLEVVDVDVPDELAPETTPQEAAESPQESLDTSEARESGEIPARQAPTHRAQCWAINRHTMARCALPPHLTGRHVPLSESWSDEDCLDPAEMLQAMLAGGGAPVVAGQPSEVRISRTVSAVPEDLRGPGSSAARMRPTDPNTLVAHPGSGTDPEVDPAAVDTRNEQMPGVCGTCNHSEAMHGGLDSEEPGCTAKGCSCFAMI